jgi:hypothetical protein
MDNLDVAIQKVKFPRIRYPSGINGVTAATKLAQSREQAPCTSYDEYRSLLRCNVTHRLGEVDFADLNARQ